MVTYFKRYCTGEILSQVSLDGLVVPMVVSLEGKVCVRIPEFTLMIALLVRSLVEVSKKNLDQIGSGQPYCLLNDKTYRGRCDLL